MIARHILAPLLAPLLASPALAAAQGASVATSKGEIVISVSVAAHVALSPAVAAGAGTAGGQTACLWLGTATKGYAVTALDAPVVWRSAAGPAARHVIAPATTLSDLSSSAARPDCDHDASLLVGYAGTGSRPATLLIAPE